MKNLSFWENDFYFNDVDVVIIGGGIVGLNAALHLKFNSSHLKILVLERGSLPNGASTKNAGFACFGSISELVDDLQRHSEEEVFLLVKKRWEGLKRLRKNLGDENIDYEASGGYELFDNKKLFDSYVSQLPFLNTQIGHFTGIKNVFKKVDTKIEAFGFQGIQHLIENSGEGQINPAKMMYHLEKRVSDLGVPVLHSVSVAKIEDEGNHGLLTFENGETIRSKHILVATNGFAKQLLPDQPVVPGRAQVLITSPIPDLKIKGTFHYDRGYFYFRNVGNRILLGGGRNLDFKTEETTENGLTDLVQGKLEELLKNVILPNKNYSIEQRWSGIMGLGDQKLSIVKKISKNISCAVRLGGMGIAIGSLIGEEAAELVLESI